MPKQKSISREHAYLIAARAGIDARTVQSWARDPSAVYERTREKIERVVKAENGNDTLQGLIDSALAGAAAQLPSGAEGDAIFDELLTALTAMSRIAADALTAASRMAKTRAVKATTKPTAKPTKKTEDERRIAVDDASPAVVRSREDGTYITDERIKYLQVEDVSAAVAARRERDGARSRSRRRRNE